MGWFNYYGLAFMAAIMIPNVVYFAAHKNEAANVYPHRAVTVSEQIGRYGCFALMIFNIPYTYFNFWFEHALVVYLCVNGGLCLLYLLFWAICWKKNNMLKALSLSVLPSCVFLFSGIALANIRVRGLLGNGNTASVSLSTLKRFAKCANISSFA